ncbi:L,D-transpeptidase family protein [Methylobacterium organophilum]|uniref:L,D-transpeptidase family protein n=1 Tax=Methylobacterium organophilum TaxID=410 RepID=UPI001F12FE22|nr:L,D-transpeptidase family protein [Methylobacterium organophilum]UMY17907.1 L,D-transpeptidase family protein [Methylobacterium organophilum]
MRALTSARSTLALAAMLTASVAMAPLARAETAAPPAPAPEVIRKAAVEPNAPAETTPVQARSGAETGAPKPAAPADAKPAETGSTAPKPAGEDPGAVPTTAGPALDPSATDAPKEEPVVAEPAAPQAPADPQGAALFARLSDAAPLLARLPGKEREALKTFYALVDFRPVWIEKGAWNAAAKSVIARLQAAGEDGLDPAAYPVPALKDLDKPGAEAALAEAELKLSAAVALYARDARGGRVNLSAISKLITPQLDLPGADLTLARVSISGDKAGQILQEYNPQTAGYRALKSRLAALRGPAPQTAASKSLRLPAGPVLKLGMSDRRVPALRAHFGLEERAAGTLDAGPGEPETYDKAVADAVADFQRSRGLPANGVLTRGTVVALALGDAPAASRGGNEADLLVNMERWRWLPGELGPDYVFVNVPEFRLRVFRGGIERDATRVIVGKPESPTPTFSGLMEYAVVNPSWFVPPSILKKEFLPGLARDPNYAARRGYQVVRRGNSISVRQPPGERNALGFIKFLFPNQHAVYLHDTPNRSLFSASYRAMSHGCVRVDDPFRFADAVLPNWSNARLKALIGKGERTIRLPEKLPVHLAYFTAYVDDDGVYRTLPDLYGYDAPMRAALGLAPATPAMAKAKPPAEAKRNVAATPTAPQTLRTIRREATGAAAPRAAPAPRAPRRESEVYGEPGLWTPELARPEPQSWW